jgi:hypothetical protein
MKVRLTGLNRVLFVAVLLGSIGLRGLSAMDVYTKVEVDENLSISLPVSWKIMDHPGQGSAQDGAGNPAGVVQFPSLLLTARPADSAQNVILSLFRTSLRMMGPPVYAGEMGSQVLQENAIEVVLSLGFTPSNTRVTHSTSLKDTPLITAEISAKNANGDERIFTYTAVARPPGNIRLFSSRPAGSQMSGKDIESIIQTISSSGAGGPPVTASPGNAPQTSGSARPNYLGSSTPGSSESPAQPVPTTPVAPSQVSASGAQLVQDDHASFIIVEGQKGVGSGFICALNGKAFAITNAHVMSENTGIKLKSLNGSLLTPGAAGIASGHDIVRLEVVTPVKPLEIMTGIDEVVKIGDPVIIPGNAGGAGVVKAIEGKVVGIGPNLIEVDAPFIKGNSGSPIIHLPTGKVLGVATYLIERKVSEGDKGEVKVETRRFGYRLDSVTQWEPVNWQRFTLQAAQIAKIQDVSEDFIRLFNSISKDNPISPGNYVSPDIQRALQEFLNVVDRGGKHNIASLADRKEAVRRLFSDLRIVAKSDIGLFDSRNAYDYFRREAVEEQQLREKIQGILTKELESRM